MCKLFICALLPLCVSHLKGITTEIVQIIGSCTKQQDQCANEKKTCLVHFYQMGK